jgi:hypothetical protein
VTTAALIKIETATLGLTGLVVAVADNDMRAAIVGLALAIVTLFGLVIRNHNETKVKLKACEDDRNDLWRRIASLEAALAKHTENQ